MDALPSHVTELLAEDLGIPPVEDEQAEDQEEQEELEAAETEEQADEPVESEEEDSEVDWRAKAEEALKEAEEAKRAHAGTVASLTGVRQEASGLKAMVAAMREDLQTLAADKVQESLPDIEDDPVGHLSAKFDQFAERTQGELEAAQYQQGQQQLQQQLSVVTTRTMQMEEEFRREKPDYDNAYQHMQGLLYQTALANGATPEQAMANVQNTAIRFAYSALQQGRNPAQEAYNIAVQYGYRPPEAAKKSEPRTKIPDEVKAGTQQKDLSQLPSKTGRPTRSKGDTVTNKEFWEVWRPHERAPYLANPDFFEAISTQSEAVLPF